MKNTIKKIKDSKFWSKFSDWIIVIIIVELILTGLVLFKGTMTLSILVISAISVIMGLTIFAKIVMFLQWNSTKHEQKVTKNEIILIWCDFIPRVYIITLILCKELMYSLIGIEFIRFLAYLFASIPAFNKREISNDKKKLFIVLALITSLIELIIMT